MPEEPPFKAEKRLGDEYRVHRFDVLCAKDKQSMAHVGKNRFRICVEMRVCRYQTAKTKEAKTLIVKEVIDAVRDSGGRFLRRERSAQGPKEERSVYFDIGNRRAADKIGKALRTATLKKSQHLICGSWHVRFRNEDESRAIANSALAPHLMGYGCEFLLESQSMVDGNSNLAYVCSKDDFQRLPAAVKLPVCPLASSGDANPVDLNGPLFGQLQYVDETSTQTPQEPKQYERINSALCEFSNIHPRFKPGSEWSGSPTTQEIRTKFPRNLALNVYRRKIGSSALLTNSAMMATTEAFQFLNFRYIIAC